MRRASPWYFTTGDSHYAGASHEVRPSASTACWAAHALATISLPDDLRILAKVDDGNDDVGLKVLTGNEEDAKRKSVNESSPDRWVDDGEE